jgi:hypothetical protein
MKRLGMRRVYEDYICNIVWVQRWLQKWMNNFIRMPTLRDISVIQQQMRKKALYSVTTAQLTWYDQCIWRNSR